MAAEELAGRQIRQVEPVCPQNQMQVLESPERPELMEEENVREEFPLSGSLQTGYKTVDCGQAKHLRYHYLSALGLVAAEIAKLGSVNIVVVGEMRLGHIE